MPGKFGAIAEGIGRVLSGGVPVRLARWSLFGLWIVAFLLLYSTVLDDVNEGKYGAPTAEGVRTQEAQDAISLLKGALLIATVTTAFGALTTEGVDFARKRKSVQVGTMWWLVLLTLSGVYLWQVRGIVFEASDYVHRGGGIGGGTSPSVVGRVEILKRVGDWSWLGQGLIGGGLAALLGNARESDGD